jgi:hypothetical protein
MHKMVARLNIEHYRLLLKSEADGPRKAMIGQLLADEEERVKIILRGAEAKKGAEIKEA